MNTMTTADTREKAELELSMFAEQADIWALAAVYIYMAKGQDPTYAEIEELTEKWEDQ